MLEAGDSVVIDVDVVAEDDSEGGVVGEEDLLVGVCGREVDVEVGV